MPPAAFIPPMLARLVRTLPEGPDWEYELKVDGYRLQAINDADKVRLYSRRGNDFTRKFAKIAAAVSKIKATSFILDGEAVAVDAQGKPSFQMLQNRASLPPGWSLAYYAFDLLTRAAFSTCRRQKRNFLSVGVFMVSLWLTDIASSKRLPMIMVSQGPQRMVTSMIGRQRMSWSKQQMRHSHT